MARSKVGKYGRNKEKIELRNKVLILCGGQTEKVYFDHIKAKMDLQNVSVKIDEHKTSNPKHIVDAAIKLKSKYNEIWCAFDKDQFIEFDDALEDAKNNNIRCAFSNKAIEFWFVLHFKDRSGHMECATLNEMISRQFNIEYKKEKTIVEHVCEKLDQFDITEVEARAERVHKRFERDYADSTKSEWCSCTTIYQLTRRLQEWNEAK